MSALSVQVIYQFLPIVLCMAGIFTVVGIYAAARSKINAKLGRLFLLLAVSLGVCLAACGLYETYMLPATGGIWILFLQLVILLYALRYVKLMPVQYHKIKSIEELDAEINERINLEEKIIAKSKQLEWAEDAANICYGYWDTVNDKITFSEGAAKVLAISPGIYMPFDAILDMTIPEDKELVKRMRSHIIVSKSVEPFTFAIAVSGVRKYIHVNGEIYLNSGVRYFRGTFQDVTEQQLFIRKIEEKNAALREIASIQSHNVRGPLATIMGLVNLVNPDDYTNEDNKEIMLGLKQASLQLDEVIKTIVEKSNALDK